MINSLKQGVFEVRENPINSDLEEAGQELTLLQDIKYQEWYQGDLQCFTKKEVKEAIKRSSFLSAVQVMKYMIRFLFDFYHQKNSQKSLSQDRPLVQDQVFSRLDWLERASLKSLTKSSSMLIHLSQRC